MKINLLPYFQVKRNKELIATGIQEIFNPMAVAQISQPIDLKSLFGMHQLQQQTQLLPNQEIQQQQLQLLQQLQFQQQMQQLVSFESNLGNFRGG